LEVSPHLLERWRGEWQARGELAFPGTGRRGFSPALTELQRIAELERKIGQLTMENDFLKKALEHFRARSLPMIRSSSAGTCTLSELNSRSICRSRRGKVSVILNSADERWSTAPGIAIEQESRGCHDGENGQASAKRTVPRRIPTIPVPMSTAKVALVTILDVSHGMGLTQDLLVSQTTSMSAQSANCRRNRRQ
jgi:transposase